MVLTQRGDELDELKVKISFHTTMVLTQRGGAQMPCHSQDRFHTTMVLTQRTIENVIVGCGF